MNDTSQNKTSTPPSQMRHEVDDSGSIVGPKYANNMYLRLIVVR